MWVFSQVNKHLKPNKIPIFIIKENDSFFEVALIEENHNEKIFKARIDETGHYKFSFRLNTSTATSARLIFQTLEGKGEYMIDNINLYDVTGVDIENFAIINISNKSNFLIFF